MALTRITKGVIKPNENYDTHNINSTGIVTAIGLDVNGNGDISGNLSVGGVLTYEDVTSIDSVGIITAQSDIHVGGGVSAIGVGTFSGLDISGDIDVDGHTNLDNVSIAGVTTFTGNPTIHNADPILTFRDSNHSPFYYYLKCVGGSFNIEDSSNGNRMVFSANGSASVVAPTFVMTGGAQVSSNLGVTGNITIGDQIIHNGDTDTKIRFPANDTIRFDTAGSQRLNINSSGNVSITNDLDVDGHTNLDNVSIAGVTTFATTVNLNTSSDPAPTRLLNIAHATSSSPLVRIYNNHASGRQAQIEYKNTQSTFTQGIQQGSPHGFITFTINPRPISFWNSSTERLRVESSGNISIFKDLDVDGHTELENVIISGLKTATDE